MAPCVTEPTRAAALGTLTMLELSPPTGAGSMAALAKLERPTARTVLNTNALIMIRSFLRWGATRPLLAEQNEYGVNSGKPRKSGE